MLDQLNVKNDQVYLTVRPPLGFFDYFTISCPNGSVWNATENAPINVSCFIIPNFPLISIVLESNKVDLTPAVKQIVQEGMNER
jgi:hypothetical protein